MIVYGLRAAWSIKEIMSHEDIKKSTVKRTLGQKLNIYRTTVRKEVPEDLRYKSYVMKRGQLMSEHSQARKRTQDWLKKNLPVLQYLRRKSGLPANLTIAFRTILCGASLSYRSLQSLTTKLRT